MRPLGAHGCRRESHHVRGLLNHLGGGLARAVPSLDLHTSQQRVALRRILGACGASEGDMWLRALVKFCCLRSGRPSGSCNTSLCKCMCTAATHPTHLPARAAAWRSACASAAARRGRRDLQGQRSRQPGRRLSVSRQHAAPSMHFCPSARTGSTPAAARATTSRPASQPASQPARQRTSRGDQKGRVLPAAAQRGRDIVQG